MTTLQVKKELMTTNHGVPPPAQNLYEPDVASSSSSSSSSSSAPHLEPDGSIPTSEMKCEDCGQCYEHKKQNVKTITSCRHLGRCCQDYATQLTARQTALITSCETTAAALKKIRNIKSNNTRIKTVCSNSKLTKKIMDPLFLELGRKVQLSKLSIAEKIKTLAEHQTVERGPTTKLKTVKLPNGNNGTKHLESGPPLIQYSTKSLKALCDALNITNLTYVGHWGKSAKAKKETERRLLLELITKERDSPGSQRKSKRKRKMDEEEIPRESRLVGLTDKAARKASKPQTNNYHQASAVLSRSFMTKQNGTGYSRSLSKILFKSQEKVHEAQHQLLIEVNMSQEEQRLNCNIIHTGSELELVQDLDYVIDQLVAKKARLLSTMQHVDQLGATQEKGVKKQRVQPQTHIHGAGAVELDD